MFEESSLKEIIERHRSLVLVAAPNYEERSIACVKWLENNYSGKPCSSIAIVLRGSSSKNVLLEELNREHRGSFLKSTGCIGQVENLSCQYPDGFDQGALTSQLQDLLLKLVGLDQADVLIDVSTMPHAIVMAICDTVKELAVRLLNIEFFFAETQPAQYATVPYAQEIGMLYGSRRGRALRDFLKDKLVSSFVFPSRIGFEGSLVFDELRQTSNMRTMHLFVPIFSDGLLDSLETMRANLSLLNDASVKKQYYYSLTEGANKLIEAMEEEAKYGDDGMVMLAAPFAHKIYSVASTFAFERAKTVRENIAVEICRLSGFQYTSVYSIGTGEMYVCHLCLR